MFLGRTPPERHAVVARLLGSVAALSLAAACGGAPETEVLVTLSAPEEPSVLSSLASIELYAQRDGQRLAFTEAAYVSGAALELPPLPRRAGIVITAVGLDAEARAVAHGSVEPRLGDDDERCCVTLCFCSPQAHEADACACGDRGCGC